MTSRENVRQVYPIILTDRTVAGNEMQKEWVLTDTLHPIYRPVGYREIVRPVYVVVSKVEHLWAVESTAIALATIANVDPEDIVGTWGDHRESEAFEASLNIDDAKKVVASAYKQKQIDILLYRKLKNLLLNPKTAIGPFGQRWETAIIHYTGIAIKGVPNCYEKLVGLDERSDAVKRKDKQRSRENIIKILARQGLDHLDAPSPEIGVELAEKYINAIYPLLVPEVYKLPKFEIKEVCPVTKRGGRVTKIREQSANEPNNRSFNRAPITALPTGFFASS